MFPFHCFNMPYQFFVLTFKCGYALLQFLPFRFQLIAARKSADLCHKCSFCLGLGGFRFLLLDILPHFFKPPFRVLSVIPSEERESSKKTAKGNHPVHFPLSGE